MAHFVPCVLAQEPPGEPPDEQVGEGEELEALLEEMYFDERVLFEEVPEVITPTRTKRTIKRSPAAITVLTGEEIRRSGFPGLAGAMRMVPGAEVMRTFSTEANVSFRGFNGAAGSSSGVLLLIDGRQIYIDFSGENNWENLPIALEDIDKVEIIRGPGSFLYGPNALHGLVNIITKRPRDMVGDKKYKVSLSSTFGEYETWISTLRGAFWDEDWGARMTVGWNDVNEYNNRDDNIKNFSFVNFIFRKDFREGHGFEVQSGFHDGNYNTVRTGSLGVDLARGYGKLNYWLDGLEFQLTGDFLHAQLKNLVIPLLEERSAPTNLVWNADVHYSRDFELLGTHTVTAGVGFVYNDAGAKRITDGRHTQRRPAFYLQDEWAILDNLFLTGGVRYDHHPIAGPDFTPQASVVWLPHEEHTLRAAYKTGFRNPSYVESYMAFQSAPYFSAAFAAATGINQFMLDMWGSDRLRSERMYSFEIGYSGKWFDRVKLGIDLFYNKITNVLEVRPVAPIGPDPEGTLDLAIFGIGPIDTNGDGVPDTRIYDADGVFPWNPDFGMQTRQFRNFGDYRVYGAELGTDVLITDNLSLWGNYSWQMMDDMDTRGSVREAPKLKGNVGAKASFPELGLYGNVWLNYFDRTEITELNTRQLGSRWMLNARLAWKFWDDRAELWVSGTNLNHDDHFEHPDGHDVGRAVYAGFQLSY